MFKKRQNYIYSWKKINIYIVYEISVSGSNKNCSNLEKVLFGAVKWTEKADIENYKYSGYGIGFDGNGTFLFLTGRFGCNIIIFGVTMSSSVHVYNKK